MEHSEVPLGEAIFNKDRRVAQSAPRNNAPLPSAPRNDAPLPFAPAPHRND